MTKIGGQKGVNMVIFFGEELKPSQGIALNLYYLWMRLLLSLRSHSFKHEWYLCQKLSIFHGEGTGNLLQYSCLENPMDRGAWQAAVHGFAKSQTGLSNFTFTCHFHALEKEMATHSRVLAWRIPGMGEPGGVYGVAQRRTQLKWLSSSSSSNIFQLRHYPPPIL